MHTTLLAWRDSLGARDRNVNFVERHAVEVTMLSERLGSFTSAARAAWTTQTFRQASALEGSAQTAAVYWWARVYNCRQFSTCLGMG
ncbi:hypothetical protein QFZ22_000099 [Streptomyces canus]|uniref:Uncharacterized protein n=1 Tax=Streptomyces canus TaxID=58343 RepID=A0AAW8F206_9ACTN|nr:hypothetical protein [Streptomyces canus]